jgi:hypothetical protein
MSDLKEITSDTWCFQLIGEPELIHIIRTRFKDRYMVVYEDAYEFNLGRVEFFNKSELESKFNISVALN